MRIFNIRKCTLNKLDKFLFIALVFGNCITFPLTFPDILYKI